MEPPAILFFAHVSGDIWKWLGFYVSGDIWTWNHPGRDKLFDDQLRESGLMVHFAVQRESAAVPNHDLSRSENILRYWRMNDLVFFTVCTAFNGNHVALTMSPTT